MGPNPDSGTESAMWVWVCGFSSVGLHFPVFRMGAHSLMQTAGRNTQSKIHKPSSSAQTPVLTESRVPASCCRRAHLNDPRTHSWSPHLAHFQGQGFCISTGPSSGSLPGSYLSPAPITSCSIQLVSLLVHTTARTSFLKCRSSPMVPWFSFHGSRYPSTEPP